MRFFLPIHYLLFLALIFARCAAVPMPAMVIPDQGNSVEATAYLGNNGVGINALYATKHLNLINVAIQSSSIFTESRAYEFGLGQVFRDTIHHTSMMLMITGGYGKYTAFPWTLGGSTQIYKVSSDAVRLSLYSNFQFRRQKSGFIARLSVYDGMSDQQRNHPSYAGIEKHKFSTIGLETIYYAVPGYHRHFLFGLGLGLSTGTSSSAGYESEKDLSPSPFFAFIGYRLAKNPKPSPLPLSQ